MMQLLLLNHPDAVIAFRGRAGVIARAGALCVTFDDMSCDNRSQDGCDTHYGGDKQG
jgi:hypothetical protein